MTTEQLRKIIAEEVRKAMQEELRSILTEAVEIASRPEEPAVAKVTKPVYMPDEPKSTSFSSTSIGDMLKETMASMTRDDYSNIMGKTERPQFDVIGSSQPAPSMVSEGTSALPSFIKNAKAIFDASLQKDKERCHTE